MARRLSQDHTMRRSKSGIRVRREPKIAPPWPKLMHVGLSGRQAGDAEREDQRPQRHHHVGGVFPGRDQDRVRIVRQDDQSLGFGCAARALKITLPWRKLTHAGLSGRRAGAAEREDECPQQAYKLGGGFPRWHEDRVRMLWRDDQSLGFGCARALKIAPPWPKLTLVGLSGRQTGAVEREDERPQQMHQLGGVFPGRDQDCVGIVGQDDQSLGFGCAASPRSPPSLATTDACWLVWQLNWSC